MLPPREDRRKRPRLDEPTASSSVFSFLRRDFSSRFYASTTRETAAVTPRDNNQLQPSETDLPTHNDTDTCTGLVHRVAAMGVNDHANELLVRVAQTAAATANVVFFPGDVQDDTDAMSSGAYAEYSAYSYESTAELLADKFGDDTNVWIVRPSRFQYGTYTCFDHFVESNRFGAVATYLPTGSAVEQLTSLMEDARTRLAEDHNLDISTLLPVHLVGFSKGGVVLNQIATEIASRWHPSTFDNTKLHADDDNEPDEDNNARDGDQEMAPSPRTQLTHQFAALVSSMHWLDSGNGSKEGAVPTDEATLAGLSTIPSLQLHVHVTPYQFDAVDRPWIKKEVLRFVGAMKRLGVVVRLQRYLEDTAVSLATHFQILRDFQLSSTTACHKSGQTHSPEVTVQPYPIQTHA